MNARAIAIRTYKAIGFGLLMAPAGAMVGVAMMLAIQGPVTAARYVGGMYGFQAGLAALVIAYFAVLAAVVFTGFRFVALGKPKP